MINSSLAVFPSQIQRIDQGNWQEMPDLLAVEEPLEILLNYGPTSARQQRSLSITMRTPGQDLELVLGFLFAEGIISERAHVQDIRHCVQADHKNTVKVALSPALEINWDRLGRQFFTHSGCGVCGKEGIASLEINQVPLDIRPAIITHKLICSLYNCLDEDQLLFRHTGGMHAAACFDMDGNKMLIREDVGRHNALDKLVGAAWEKEMIPHQAQILLLSGRVSYDLVQKAIVARIPIIVAMGAPSSLAVSLANSFNLTLIGFLKPDRFNIYSCPERIKQAQKRP